VQNPQKITIIGAGVNGLGIGWQLARNGADVLIVEKNRAGEGASKVAAGMLAPYAEADFEEIDLLQLGEESLQRYPKFIRELRKDSEIDPVFDQCGTLFVGLDSDDAKLLRRLYNFRKELNLEVEWPGVDEVRERQPLLAPGITSAVWLPTDSQVNNRLLIIALKKAFKKQGGKLLESTEVTSIEINQQGKIKLKCGEQRLDAQKVIISTGCSIPAIEGVRQHEIPPVRPVKGQILSLRQNREVQLQHIIRTPRIYMVPKSDGLIRVGATTEEMGFDTTITAGAIRELLNEAWDTLPAIYDLEMVEMLAGLRPATPDHGPVIGNSIFSGLYYATGHYRNGILLAPVTAYEVAKEILTGEESKILDKWRPDRFRQHQNIK